jgi:hypothetical protein
MSEIEDVVEYHADGTRTVRIQPKREWVGLTDEELHDLQIEHLDDPWANFKAIEQALKDKNT